MGQTRYLNGKFYMDFNLVFTLKNKTIAAYI